MKNQISVATKNTKKATKPTGTKLVKGAKGMEVKTIKPKKPVLQLMEGVTGKQLRQAQFNCNREYLNELRSPSGAYRGFQAHYQYWGSLIVGFNMEECTPDKVLDFRTERQKSYKGVSVFVYSEAVKKFYLSKNSPKQG